MTKRELQNIREEAYCYGKAEATYRANNDNDSLRQIGNDTAVIRLFLESINREAGIAFAEGFNTGLHSICSDRRANS